MKAQGRGHIINVCSQLGYIGRANYTAYSTAKGGMIAFTRALAKELAGDGILVNGVAPGLVDTGFDPLSDRAKQDHASGLPLQRLGKVIELLVSMLATAHHAASTRDPSQIRLAALQCEQLMTRVKGTRLLTGLWQMDRLRKHVANVGEDVEKDQNTLLTGVKPQAFAHPFEAQPKKRRT